jgi:DNA polymerase III alpha subunit (gram-positive type)
VHFLLSQITQALRTFAKWLNSLQQPVHLVFHNAFAFDIQVLWRHFQNQNIPFPECVLNIHDSLPLFANTWQYLKFQVFNWKLWLNIPLSDAHNAIHDAGCLRGICETFVKTKDIELSNFLNGYVEPVLFFQAKLKTKEKEDVVRAVWG